MIRFAAIILAALMAAPVAAQNVDDITGPVAWAACQQAKKDAHAINPSSAKAVAALGQAGAALSTVPAKYKDMFQPRFDRLKADLQTAAKLQGEGEVYRASADGAYAVIARRVASGNWLGVTDAARACTTKYYKAIRKLNAAEYGYGYVEDGAKELKREIEQFVSMLEAFEDFYGPIP